MRIFAAILIGLAVGAVVGFTLAPRMHASHLGKEELLRQRAADYYAASRRLDRWGMVRMFTPARQLEQAEALAKEAAGSKAAAAKISAHDQQEAEETAAGIKPGQIDVRLEGDWAVTSGKYDLIAFGQHVPAQLDRYLWVYSDGQWWQYNFGDIERSTYGHPPDFGMALDPWQHK